MELFVHQVYMWTDSQVTLKCIKNENRHFSNFVMNRIHEIREKTDISSWHYVKSKDNVADYCTRSCELANCKQWFIGPSFLKHKNILINNWAEKMTNVDEEDFESKSVNILVKDTISHVVNWKRYSDWVKLLRHYTWIMKLKSRWLKNKRTGKKDVITPLTAEEMFMTSK